MLFSLLYCVVWVLQQSVKPLTIVGLVVFQVLALRFWPVLEYEVRCRILIIFLVLASRGRDPEKILKLWLCALLLTFFAAILGLAFGFTFNQFKWHISYGTGYALGYIHPNNASRMLFWIAMLLWVLFWKDSYRIPFLLFGTVALVSIFYTRCRTIAVFACITPSFILYLHKRNFISNKKFQIVAVAAPFLCLCASLILSYALIPLIPLLRHSALWNFLSRFVQNNIALQEYGVGITGQWINFLGEISRDFYGETIALRILDNAYVPWMIRKGIILTLLVLSLDSLAIFKIIKENRPELVFISVLILVYGILEPAALQLQYNFSFLFLLTGRKEDQSVHIQPA